MNLFLTVFFLNFYHHLKKLTPPPAPQVPNPDTTAPTQASPTSTKINKALNEYQNYPNQTNFNNMAYYNQQQQQHIQPQSNMYLNMDTYNSTNFNLNHSYNNNNNQPGLPYSNNNNFNHQMNIPNNNHNTNSHHQQHQVAHPPPPPPTSHHHQAHHSIYSNGNNPFPYHYQQNGYPPMTQSNSTPNAAVPSSNSYNYAQGQTSLHANSSYGSNGRSSYTSASIDQFNTKNNNAYSIPTIIHRDHRH